MHELKTRSRTKDRTFALTWTGTLGGAALATDASPNVTPPAAARIFRYGAQRDGVMQFGGCLLRCCIADGTTLTVQAWYYDDTQALWVKMGITAVLTFSAGNIANPGGFSWGNMSGAKIFFQITANTGCTVFGWGLT
jgi:hypothetical protein